MKWRITVFVALVVVVSGGAPGCARQGETAGGDLVYKIETGGVLAGYTVVDTMLVVVNGTELIKLEQRNHFKAMLLGSEVDTDSRLTFVFEPTGKRVLNHEGESVTGTNQAAWSIEWRDGQVHGSSSFKRDDMELELPPNAIVENTLFFDFLVADFAGTPLAEKTYPILDIADFEFRDTRYEKHAEETLELAGTKYDVIVVDRSVAATGTLLRMWIDTATAMVVKILEQDGNVTTLADASVIDRVERVDLDKYILDKTDVAIADVAGITYMKVRARMRPIGLNPTPELMNVRGQKFTGTVVDNLIDGIFEIEHVPYDGNGAPAFPNSVTEPALTEYLAADGIFEADDEILAAQAREITGGATDAWEAATRLAAWVSAEINYAIPGGGTARNTYDIRAGECGAHSVLLATFCRTVGIPARMVWGCMYTPNHGGSFGQHGWTEVHMGPAGWIPVDATVGETDFVDSGHIRVAHFGSVISRLNAQEFKILDYRVAGGDAGAMAAAETQLAPYLGQYKQAGSSRKAEVSVMDGSLVVNLPDQTMLAMDEPDDEGRWVCKLARHVYVTFDHRDHGDVESFELHEVHSLPRKVVPEVGDADAPADLVPFLGRYHLAALTADFLVSWQKGKLVLGHPQSDHPLPLEPTGENGVWRTVNGPYTISFVTGDEGQVESLTLDAASEFRKK